AGGRDRPAGSWDRPAGSWDRPAGSWDRPLKRDADRPGTSTPTREVGIGVPWRDGFLGGLRRAGPRTGEGGITHQAGTRTAGRAVGGKLDQAREVGIRAPGGRDPILGSHEVRT